MGLFLSGLLIHVITWMFFQTEAGWKPRAVSTRAEEMRPDAREHGVCKEKLFLQRTATPLYHHQPFNLVKGSENIILSRFSILDFQKLPIRDDVSSDDAHFSPAMKKCVLFPEF